ncbi:hypothetical protein BOVAC1_977 [Bacteroides ovatus]|uniref:Uncharacterized protein n=1 Tax=Bacteroides ovatus (strain ATCC 8483 / DSM 1896 / JCM 5824 / BCRC 10623 / CCUG 4943 / NCTC 11153) TaxID=411476 RepID=A0AAN3D4J5_BACO1|nr:hypothetical protein BACOVA_04865 [Bacteroides ovatus ATCC 8483]KDS16254.1 hypothetical protein M088_0950 [Bacteroides ovatus str. 3725 D1 iv]KDS21736.1 hypothetical protein M082_0664 [Bacteroides fragilis str. 3725 D9 ii]CAG9866622.1 hypothetical protein BOVAC1_977 [Bacteroides ovatus]CAG9885962.1 hypothetical protein BOVA711_4255 [Bacteroides ovatus]
MCFFRLVFSYQKSCDANIEMKKAYFLMEVGGKVNVLQINYYIYI